MNRGTVVPWREQPGSAVQVPDRRAIWRVVPPATGGHGSNGGERGDASRTYPQTGGACSSTLTNKKSRAIVKT